MNEWQMTQLCTNVGMCDAMAIVNGDRSVMDAIVMQCFKRKWQMEMGIKFTHKQFMAWPS